jgi:hypothetical protein
MPALHSESGPKPALHRRAQSAQGEELEANGVLCRAVSF